MKFRQEPAAFHPNTGSVATTPPDDEGVLVKRHHHLPEQTQSFALDAKDRAVELAEDLSDKVKPYLTSVREVASPVARDVKINTASTMGTLLENAHTYIDDVAESQLFQQAMEQTKRSRKQARAFAKTQAKELTQATGKKRHPVLKLGLTAGLASVAAAASLGVRKYLGSAAANGWAAHQASTVPLHDEGCGCTPTESQADNDTTATDAEPRRSVDI
ncbi:MAG: hypothetical protein ACRCWS_03495 [Propionibacteriaceae bacterium]